MTKKLIEWSNIIVKTPMTKFYLTFCIVSCGSSTTFKKCHYFNKVFINNGIPNSDNNKSIVYGDRNRL